MIYCTHSTIQKVNRLLTTYLTIPPYTYVCWSIQMIYQTRVEGNTGMAFDP